MTTAAGVLPSADVLSSTDVLSDAALLDVARNDELLRRRAEGLLIARLIEIERRRLYAVNGYTDVAGWGRGELRWEAVEARSRRNLAKLAVFVPEVIERLLDGRIGVAQAHLIGRLFKAPRVGRYVCDFIDTFFRHAAEMDYRGFEQYCRAWKLLVDQDGAKPIDYDRSATCAFSDYEFRLTMLGPAADGVKWDAMLQRFEQIEFEIDWASAKAQHGDAVCADLLPRTPAQRRYDALQNLLGHVELPKAGTGTAGDGDSDSDGGESDPADADVFGDIVDTGVDARVVTSASQKGPDGAVTTVVNIVADLQTWMHQLDRIMGFPGVRPWLEPFGPKRGFSQTIDGVQIHPRDAVLASLYGKVRCVVVDDLGRPIKMTSSGRLFSGALAEAVLLTATTCTHPGCQVPGSRSQIDHLTPHSHGGETSIGNAGLACRHHNNWRYTARARTYLRGDSIWITEHADGTRIAPAD